MMYKKDRYYDEDGNIVENGLSFTGTYCDISGNIYTYTDGLLHSVDDKPAIIMINGDKHWYNNGVQHRMSRPAIIFVDKQDEYYYNGVKIELGDYLKDPQKSIDIV